jgi:hypothetical protein
MSGLRRALTRFRALSRSERRVLGEAVLLLPVVHITQTVLPFRRWRRLLMLAQGAAPARPAGIDPAAVAAAVERARRLVPGRYRCLPVAYTTHLLLAHYGHPSDIHVGVSHDRDGKVEAHAWVVCGARIVVGDLPDLSRFVPLPGLDR